MRTRERLEKMNKGEASRTRIMAAARKIFAEHGLGRSRIDHLSAESGLNRAMIYYFFKGKKHLYKEVITEVLGEVARLVDLEVSRSGHTPETLLLFPGKYLQLYFERSEISRIILREIASGGEVLREIRADNPELFSPFHKVVAALKSPEVSAMTGPMDMEMLVLLLMTLGYMIPSALSLVDLLATPTSVAKLRSPEAWKGFITELVARYMGLSRNVRSHVA